MRTKKLRILLFLLLLFLLGIIVLMNITISTPKLRDIAIAHLEKALGRQVKMEELRVNLWRGIQIKELFIENHKDFQSGAFIRGERLLVRYKLLPLLRRRLVIGKVALINPQILIERNQEGNWNFSDLLESKPSLPSAKPLPSAKKISLLVSKIIITGGKVDFLDRKISRPPTETRLENLDLSLSGFSLTSPFQFNLTGTLVGEEAAKVNWRGKLNLPLSTLDSSLLIDNFVISHYGPYLQEYAPLGDLTGRSNLNLNCRLDKEKHLNLAGKIDLKDMGLKFLSQPGAKEPPLEQLDNVDVSIEVNLSGNLNHPLKVSQLEGLFHIGQGKAKLTGVAEPIDNIKGKIKFEGDKVSISDLGARLGDSSFGLKGEVKNFNNPHFDLFISSRVEAGTIKDLFSEKLGTKLTKASFSGLASLDCRVKGTLVKSSVEGKLNLKNISLGLPPSSLSNISGSVNFNHPNLSLIKPEEALTGWNGEGRINMAKGSFNKIEFNHLDTHLSLQDEELKLRDMKGKFYQGDLKAEGYLNFSKPAYSFKSDLKGVDVSSLLSSVSEFKDMLSGKLEGQVSLKGNQFSPQALSGQGELKIKKGKLIGMPLMRILVSLLGVPSLGEIEFEEIFSHFVIEEETVKTDEVRLISPDVDMFAQGSFDFDTNLNYQLTIRLSPELSAKTSFLGLKYLQDEEGRTIIKADITGPFEEPKTDILKAQMERVIEKGIEELLKEIFK